MKLPWMQVSNARPAVNGMNESAGHAQAYVEDCQVCCRPNVLTIRYDPVEQEFLITAQLE